MRTRLFALPWPPRSSVLGVSCFNQLDHVETMARMYRIIVSLSIKRFWGKGERSDLLSPSPLGRPDNQAK